MLIPLLALLLLNAGCGPGGFKSIPSVSDNGTSAVRPGTMGAVVLNDIGPVIEREGLLRIVSYIGRIPLPATWAEAGALVRSMGQRQFPAVPDNMWEELARQQYNDEAGRPAHGYDQALNRTASILDGPLPEIWELNGSGS